MSARELAAHVVRRVVDDGSFSQHALAAALERSQLDARERARATDLVYGTLTWRRTIDAVLDTLLPRGVDSLPPPARALLRVATFQLLHRSESTPAYAVVDETVSAARKQVGARLANLTNAVLRNVERQRESILASFDTRSALESFGLRHGIPDWITQLLFDRLSPDEAEEAMKAFNAPTRTHLRVRRGSVEDVRALLREDGIESEAHPLVPDALVCSGGNPAATRAFQQGAVAIQDTGAQLAALAFPQQLEGPVLDACAGLGGKSVHLADRYPGARVICTDRQEKKLRQVHELAREGSHVDTFGWDLTDEPVPGVTAAGPYEAVLLDAPCSGLGTLGRHPEVRWNRTPSDVPALAAVQATMLDRTASLVRPGGWLLYVVCTWTPAEGREQVLGWLERNPDFVLAPPDETSAHPGVPWGTLVDAAGTITLWPHTAVTDGFTMARMQRRA